MRAVLTGGAGFLGSAVATAFRESGIAVTILDRPDRLKRVAGLIPGDELALLELDSIAGQLGGADIMVHLAWSSLPATSMTSVADDAQSNIVPSARHFDAAAGAGVGRILFASSGGTVYGDTDVLPIDEEHLCRPVSAYGVGKLSVEHYLRIIGATNDINAVSLRVANPTGPFQFRGSGVGAIAHFISAVLVGKPVTIWGDGSIVRDYLYIDDVADAFLRAAIAPRIPSGEYNVGSGVGTSLQELLEVVFSVAGRRTKVEYLAPRAFDVPAVALDSSKLSKAVGWQPTLDVESIVKRMWNYATTS